MATTSRCIQITAPSALAFQISSFSARPRPPGRPCRLRGLLASRKPWCVASPLFFCPPYKSNPPQTHELDQKIQDVYKRIQTERKVLEASQLLRQATTNPDVLRRNDAKIREAERSLSYFEDTLRELQSRKMAQAQRDDPSRSGGSGSYQPGTPTSPHNGRSSGSDRFPQPSPSDAVSGARSARTSPELRMSGGGTAGDDTYGSPKPKTYTNLDLIKADTPHTSVKISRMLHQLEFKLQVEMQYKKGIDKMAKLYQADGDKKSRADAESKKVESERKIQLLQTALKRYKNLHILDDADDDDDAGMSQSHSHSIPLIKSYRRAVWSSRPWCGW